MADESKFANPEPEKEAADSGDDRLGFASRLSDLGIEMPNPGSVSDIVTRAATVLEEELASGILAARRVEERFVDVEKLRSKDSDEMMQRIRRDVHDLVDILVDLLDIASSSFSGVARRAVTLRTSTTPSSGQVAHGMSVLDIPDTVAPGASSGISMMVDNDSDTEAQSFDFVVSDLVSTHSNAIPSSSVIFEPSSLTLGPRERRRIDITVDVPDDAEHGTYAGVIDARPLDDVRAVLALKVG